MSAADAETERYTKKDGSAVKLRLSLRLMWASLAVGMLWLAGCEELRHHLKTDRTRFFAPNKVVKAPQRPSVYPILPSLSPADTTVEILPNAEKPGPDDWTYTDEDYVIGPTDIVDVSILDLFSDGLETVLRREVSASGYIDLPQLTQRIRANGRTQEKLKEAIRQAYIEDEVLQDPTVSVTLAARRQNTFSILGAIGRPGTYSITRKDMRLLDALALAGDVTQTNIDYLYLIRPMPAIRKPTGEAAPARKAPPKPARPRPGAPLDLPDLPKLEDETEPRDAGTKPAGDGKLPKPAPATEKTPAKPAKGAKPPPAPPKPGELGPATEEALRELREFMSGPGRHNRQETASDAGASSSVASETAAPRGPGRKFAYTNGRWARVVGGGATTSLPAGAKPPQAPPAPPARAPKAARLERTGALTRSEPHADEPADPYGWRQYDWSTFGRVIAVHLGKLKNGDPRMNIVIRNNDIIHVPPLEVGEFYVMGEVARPGVYSLTGRQITVKQALAAAGNLGPLAWPENSALVRRLGANQEQVVPLNVEAICHGDEPDVFLKPNDVLAIGTDVRAPFAAVVRNAFRLTYGFGFIYDRNFADPMIGSADSKRFTRW